MDITQCTDNSKIALTKIVDEKRLLYSLVTLTFVFLRSFFVKCGYVWIVGGTFSQVFKSFQLI